MVRLNLTRPRTLGIGLAVVSLAFAACSKSNGTPTPSPTSTPTAAPTNSSVPFPLQSPCSSTLGLAFEPDAGNGGAFKGIQVTHFEDNATNLCAATAAPNATPPGVAFVSAVGPLAFASDLSDGLAVLQNGSGGYTLGQDIFGASVGALVPVGPLYDFAVNPVATASPAGVAPIFADVQSVQIVGASANALGIFAGGYAAATPAKGLLALTSLTSAPPLYAQYAPFSGGNYHFNNAPDLPRSIVRFGTDASGNAVALVRGPQDVLAYAISSAFQFDVRAENTTLGYGNATTLRGAGAMALSPADATRALLGATSAGGPASVTLVTGLPNAITAAPPLALPGNVRSVAISATGAIGVIGTDAGIVVVKGVDTGTLAIVPPFAPGASGTTSVLSYRTCNGTVGGLGNVASVRLSADGRYLVALGTTAGVTCASGFNASLVAVPFDGSTGTEPTPAPTTSASPVPRSFVQNNIIAPPAGADYLIVH